MRRGPMTATAKRRDNAPAWWSPRRNGNRLWFAVIGAGALVVLGLFIALQAGGDGGSDASSRFASIYTFKTADKHALTFDPSNPGRLVFGHHGGVMESTDGGRSWDDLVAQENFDGMNLAFDPADANTLYLAGHNLFAGSADGGASWRSLETNLPALDLHAFAASAATPGRFYAFAMGGGLFMSNNGVADWTALWPEAPMGTHSIVEAGDQTLLVGSADKGIQRSDDGGQTWTESRTGIDTGVIYTVKSDPQGTKVYAGTSRGLFTSNDRGLTWTATSLDDTQVTTVSVNPQDAEAVMAIDTTGSLYRSTDGGSTWSP